ncbi:hypothetical protein [Clostridium sp. HMP27]|uniref:hypothetical protein n=1 Tax=Clostridium sp. HMP27 TaxID=1487921 RepID=UPI00052CFCFA|nr:hypothetical protein [Clostridium sp. HMP27]KGK87576.1 hypothetical protein DP68_09775 [Clostridium sp. HMP27]
MDNKKCRDIETENRIEELINVVENHTRTKRHLEQHSDIASPNQLSNAKHIQQVREDNIDSLKDKIVYDDGGPTKEKENIRKNIEFANGYIKNNKDHMGEKQLENMLEKQENRHQKLNELQ